MVERKRFLLFAVVLAAIALFELRSLLFLGRTFFRADVSYNIEPSCFFACDFFRQHHTFAAWNPWILCGVSQVAAIWPLIYPPAFEGLFLPFGVATGCYMLTHLLVAGIGGYLWYHSSFENEDKKAFAGIFFALAFAFNGYMFGATINLSLMAAASWIPLALFFVDQIIRAPKWWQCGALTLVLSLQFAAGRPEIAMGAYLLYLLRVVGCMKYASQPASPANPALPATWLSSFFLVSLSMFFSVSMNAANILPLYELLTNNPSATDLSVYKATYWSTGWRDWLSMLIPLPAGKINMTTPGAGVTYPGAIPYLVSIYLGPVVLTLAAIGAVVSAPKNWMWIIFGLFMIGLSLGEFGPLSFMYANQNLVRYPVKFGIFVIFSLLTFAASGLSIALNGKVSKRMAIVFACLWGALVLLARLSTSHLDAGAIDQITVAGFGGILCCLTVVLKGKWRLPAFLAAAVLPLLVNCELQLNDLAPASVFASTSSIAHLIKSRSNMDRKEYRVLSLLDNSIVSPSSLENESEPLDQSFTKYCREILRPNCNIDFQVQTSNGMSVIPTWTSLFIDTGLLPRSTLSAVKHPLGKSNIPLYRFCQATSTAFVITTSADADGNWVETPGLEEPRFHLVETVKRDNVRVYSVNSFRPRVALFEKTKTVGTRIEALKYINRADINGYDPLHEVLLVAQAVPDGKEVVPAVDEPPAASGAQSTSGRNNASAATVPNGARSTSGKDNASVATVSSGARSTGGRDNASAATVPNGARSTSGRDNASVATEPSGAQSTSGNDRSSTKTKASGAQSTSGKDETIAGRAKPDQPDSFVRMVRDGNDSLQIEAKCARPSTLVLTDGYYPGWEAFDNGKPVEIKLADGLVRAVSLQAGAHEIEMYYRPRSFFCGIVISFVTLFMVAGLLLGLLKSKGAVKHDTSQPVD